MRPPPALMMRALTSCSTLSHGCAREPPKSTGRGVCGDSKDYAPLRYVCSLSGPCRRPSFMIDTYPAPAIMRIAQHNAHDDKIRAVHPESRAQTGASGAGVGLQPPASATHPDGTDGADTAVHPGDWCRVPGPCA